MVSDGSENKASVKNVVEEGTLKKVSEEIAVEKGVEKSSAEGRAIKENARRWPSSIKKLNGRNTAMNRLQADLSKGRAVQAALLVEEGGTLKLQKSTTLQRWSCVRYHDPGCRAGINRPNRVTPPAETLDGEVCKKSTHNERDGRKNSQATEIW
eukprot:Gb_07460 [translate_table: standard]